MDYVKVFKMLFEINECRASRGLRFCGECENTDCEKVKAWLDMIAKPFRVSS
jgi:hypothetical protein